MRRALLTGGRQGRRSTRTSGEGHDKGGDHMVLLAMRATRAVCRVPGIPGGPLRRLSGFVSWLHSSPDT